MIRILPTVVPAPAGTSDGNRLGADHPIRKVTRLVAFEPGGWTAERATQVSELFDGLAPEWHTRDTPGRGAPVEDALERGGLVRGLCVELGSGTGHATRVLRKRFDRLLALDISMEMLRHAPPEAGVRVRADAGCLPLRDRSVDVLVLVNMFLFPHEVDRVLGPDGALLWVSSRGNQTPIYLEPTEVEAALPGAWEGLTAAAGRGMWCVLRRARATVERAPGTGR